MLENFPHKKTSRIYIRSDRHTQKRKIDYLNGSLWCQITVGSIPTLRRPLVSLSATLGSSWEEEGCLFLVCVTLVSAQSSCWGGPGMKCDVLNFFKLHGGKEIKSMKASVLDRLDSNTLREQFGSNYEFLWPFIPYNVELISVSQGYYRQSAYWYV